MTIDVGTSEVASDERAGLRRTAYVLLIVAACATMTGRIARVESRSGESPLLSANDRSRWAAIRALVDHGTFELDAVVLRPDVAAKPAPADSVWPFRGGPPSNRDRQWYSIDMVRHRGRDGREHYYSSKPPLLNLLLAAPYWLFKQATGATLADQPFYVVRSLLVLLNVLPFALFLAGIAGLAERHGRTDWGRLFVVGTAAFGTLLTPFASTLNNHSFAALAVMGALWSVDRVQRSDGRQRAMWTALAGLGAALATVGELPALSFTAAVLTVLAWSRPREALFWGAPPVVLVFAAALGANVFVHDSWRTPYAHRRDGAVLARIPAPDGRRFESLANDEALREAVRSVLAERLDEPTVSCEWIPTADPRRFVLWEETRQRRWAVALTGEGAAVELRQWDNWYEYEGTYWTDEGKAGVDRGERSVATYGFHATLGHHGLVSLTPVWLLACLGVGIWLRSGDSWQKRLALGVAAMTLVVLAFYVVGRPQDDRNYGGVSCGFRWMNWLIPLWLACLIPGADAASRTRWGRVISWGLLAISVFSAAYSATNPWEHPWLFEYWTRLGWIAY